MRIFAVLVHLVLSEQIKIKDRAKIRDSVTYSDVAEGPSYNEQVEMTVEEIKEILFSHEILFKVTDVTVMSLDTVWGRYVTGEYRLFGDVRYA